MDNPLINGLYVLVLGVLVVFFGMIIIILAVSICGKIISKPENTEKKVEKSVESKPVANSAPQTEEVPAHVKAAIIAAISAYYFNSQSKCYFVVKKIKRF